MKHCLLLMISLAGAGVRAQDYLVTTKMDTLRGRISVIPYEKLDKILLTVDRKKTEYPAYLVVRAYFDSALYQPVRTPEAFRLMRIKRSGMLSLCYASQSPGRPYNIPYLVKITGESMEVNALGFKKSMTRFLEECTSIRQKIEEESLGRNDLEKIVEGYNRCLEQQTTVSFTATEDPKLSALNSFNKKLTEDTAVPSETRDMVKDLYQKVKEGKAVPNYLAEALRDALKDFPAYKDDFEKLLETLKK